MKISLSVFALLCLVSAVGHPQTPVSNPPKQAKSAYSSSSVIEFRPERFQVHDLRAIGNVELSVLIDTKTGCSWVFANTDSGLVWKFVPIDDGKVDAAQQRSLCLDARIPALEHAVKQ